MTVLGLNVLLFEFSLNLLLFEPSVTGLDMLLHSSTSSVVVLTMQAFGLQCCASQCVVPVHAFLVDDN